MTLTIQQQNIGTKEIPLTQGKVAIVDASDYDSLVGYRWRVSAQGYAVRHSGHGRAARRCELMHRRILNAPDGVQVDHRDGDRLNNTRCNLRLSTAQQNRFNMRPRGERRFKGVRRLASGRHGARIKVNYRPINLGSFDREEDAARAYDAKATELFGEFAWLNFPR